MQETLDKDIQTSFQSIKVQVTVAQNELQTKQGVKRIMKKYQGRISEMLKLIQKQKKQNETLKVQFKQLNQQLNSVLKKIQQRPKQQEQKNNDLRVEVIKKQLENQIKKSTILKKEVQQLRYKCKYLDSEKLDSFKNQIKEKQRAIQQLNAQIKLFQRLDKQEKNGDSYKKEQELSQKIMQLNEEIIHYKKKLQQSKKKQQELQKSIKNLRQQIIQAENKGTVSKTNPEKQKSKAEKQLDYQIQNLKQKYKQLQNAKKMNDKNSRQEIENLSQKVKSLQRQLNETKQTINRKEKESNILLFKLKQKERKNYNTLQPIKSTRYFQHILHSTGNLFEVRKQSKGLSWGQGIFRQFDDISKLPIQKNYRIKKINFFYFQQHILSLETTYEIFESDSSKNTKKQMKMMQTFAIPAQYANTKSVDYNFADYQYIRTVEIYCNRGIEFIKIITSKQQLLEIGNPKSIPKCKQQIFQIGHFQKPIAFFGVVQNKRMGGQNREILVSLGLQLKKKQVFIRGKARKLQSSLNRSVLQASRSKNSKIKQN